MSIINTGSSDFFNSHTETTPLLPVFVPNILGSDAKYTFSDFFKARNITSDEKTTIALVTIGLFYPVSYLVYRMEKQQLEKKLNLKVN